MGLRINGNIWVNESLIVFYRWKYKYLSEAHRRRKQKGEFMKKPVKYIIPFILIFLTVLGAGVSVKIHQFRNCYEDQENVLQGNEWSRLFDEKETMIDYVSEDSTVYLLISREGHKVYGDYLTILRKEQGEWVRIYDNDFEELKPWKIRLGDIDGDGRKEILTAVYKTAHYDEVYKNRMFIFNYEDGILTKKWTGSQFAGEWNDFYATNLLNIPGDELIFIEETEEGMEKISIYYWFDFGFLELAESEEYPDIKDLVVIDENRMRITFEDERRNSIDLTVNDGKISKLE